MKNKFIKDNFRDFIKFGLVGVVNTFTSYGIVNTCFYVFHIHEQISNIIAFILSVIVSFTLNSIFVFKKKPNSIKDLLYTLGKTYLSYAFTGLFLTAILIEIECNKIGIPLYIASLMNLVLTVPINFILNKFWAFKKKNYDYKELAKKHTFAICAYKESPYLEEMIKSIMNQTIKTNVLIATSTPNKHIEGLAKKYNIPLFIKDGKPDIQGDWNFAVSNAKTELVTVAHQDDIYDKDYSKYILENYTGKELLLTTDNYYYINNKSVDNKNLKLKRILKLPLKIPVLKNVRWIRKMTLSLGNTVQCPSATYNTKLIKGDIFTSDLKFGLDWDTFLKIYKMKGKIKYIPKKLMSFRISDESTTKKSMENDLRYKEDNIMFNKFWPKFITKLIMKFYVKAYDVYDEDKKKDNKKSILKSFFFVNLILLLSITIGFSLMYFSYKIPTEKIKKNAFVSAGTLKKEGIEPSLFKSKNIVSRLDNFTDSLMILNSFSLKDESTLSNSLLNYRYNSTTPYHTLIGLSQGEDINDLVMYPRYWHGYLIVLKPLLFFTDYHNIRLLNTILQVFIMIFIIALLLKNKFYKLIIPYSLTILSLIPMVIFKSLQFSTVFYIFNLGIILILLFNKKIKTNFNIVYYIFSLLGILTAYFDLLTYPLVTFGIPIIVLLSIYDVMKFKNLFFTGFYWLYSYILMWGSKWIIATHFTKEDVLKNALDAANERMADSNNFVEFNKFDVIRNNFNMFFNRYILISIIILFLVLIIAVIKHKCKFNKTNHIFILLISLLPFVWYVVLSNHSIAHSWMTNKILSITYFGIMMIMINSIKLGKRRLP